LVKAFRLFVSSTFQDFAQERELLQGKVFPALEAFCAARGYQFQAIDLRWGVSEEAQLDQRTVEICLGEVTSAKGYPPPNFLIMIGDRYGWAPLPFAIPSDEFEALAAWLDEHGRAEAARSLRKVYGLDENHLASPGLAAAATGRNVLTSAYTLRSRADGISELAAADAWAQAEAQLRGALQEASDHLRRQGRLGETADTTYHLSLTEQEIMHGLPGYGRRDQGGARWPAAQPGQEASADGSEAIAWIREVEPQPADADVRVTALKSNLRRALPENRVLTAQAIRDEDGRLDDDYLQRFVAAMRRSLGAAVERHIAAIAAVERTAGFELGNERAAHHAFAEARRALFVGRDRERAAIRRFVAGSGTHPLVVHGRSGSGKSALMAAAMAEAERGGQEPPTHVPATPVIGRFIGASAASSDLRAMLTSLADELAGLGVAPKPDQWENDAGKFIDQVRQLISSIDQPVVIFVDALDQLRRPYRPGWLPDEPPAGVRIVVSVLSDETFPADSDVFQALTRRLPADAFLEIEPLTRAEGRDILVSLESNSGRRLRADQRDYILARFENAGASPLYLKVAFEIARAWRSTDVAGHGGRELAEEISALIVQFIDQLSSIHHHERTLVSRTLGYLAAARDGLSGKELTDVLARDTDVMTAVASERFGAQTHKLPVAVWVRLHRQLGPFLVERRIDGLPVLGFFHRQLAEVVRARHYLPARIALHAALAGYFDTPVGRPDGEGIESGDEGTCVYARRTLSELPHQLFHAENRTRLDQLLTAADWMQQKLDAFGAATLVADYEQFATGTMQSLIGQTLRLTMGICARDPRQLLPQLVGRLMASPDPAAPGFVARARRSIACPTLLPWLPSLTPPGVEVARLEGHDAWVTALIALPDGRLASGSGGMSGGHGLSDDDTIRLWDLTTGVETLRIMGSGQEAAMIAALAVIPSGDSRTWLLAAAYDKRIRLFDPQTGAETAGLDCPAGVWPLAAFPASDRNGWHLAVGSGGSVLLWDPHVGTLTGRLEGHDANVSALAVFPGPDGEGWRLASASVDKSILLWDLRTGSQIGRLTGHDDTINALAVLPADEGGWRLASASDDKTVRLWDLQTGSEVARLEGHDDHVHAVAAFASGDGNEWWIASGADDGSLRVWDTRSGREAARLENGDAWIRSLVALPPSQGFGWRLASGATDAVVRVWDTRLLNLADDRARIRSARRERHSNSVTALAVLPSSPGARWQVASGSADTTIRLWDIETGVQAARLDGHEESVRALAALPATDGSGSRLVSGSYDKTVRFWDVRRGVETSRFVDPESRSVNALAALPSTTAGDWGLATAASPSNWIRIWRLGGRGLIPVGALRNRKRVWAMALVGAADGDRWLAVGSDDHAIDLWDLATAAWDDGEGAEVIGRLVGHTAPVVALAVIPGSDPACCRLASGSNDKSVRIWDLKTDREIAVLTGHRDWISDIAVLPSADGEARRLASCSIDKSVRVWDLRTATEIARLELDAGVTCLAALPDGRLVAADAAGQLHWLELVD
jgi:WD40 repeat protein